MSGPGVQRPAKNSIGKYSSMPIPDADDARGASPPMTRPMLNIAVTASGKATTATRGSSGPGVPTARSAARSAITEPATTPQSWTTTCARSTPWGRIGVVDNLRSTPVSR